ncbi:uncharacterized protein LOC135222245 [Macrobrachium nipponense]|uniref:uncharacterized protein LOC135222245 n=1 Tax=Macrobrachium nipponense TaxID=159736 RepID=UPI0030C8145B
MRAFRCAFIAIVCAVVQGEDQESADANTRHLPVGHNYSPGKSLLDIFATINLGSNPTYGGSGISTSCRYWCETPEGAFYCCGQPTSPRPRPVYATLAPPRAGCCPAVRPVCTKAFVSPPVPCAYDSECFNSLDKCCFDRCLQRHVCKPAEPCYVFNYWSLG